RAVSIGFDCARASASPRPNVPMPAPQPQKPDYTAAMRSWTQNARWYRRLSARLGLQGKLIVCFMFLLVLAMAGSYWLFLRESRATLWHNASERTASLAQTLAMAATAPLDTSNYSELTRMSKDF